MNSSSSYTKLSKHLKHQKCHFHRNSSSYSYYQTAAQSFCCLFLKCPFLLHCKNKKTLVQSLFYCVSEDVFFWNLNHRNPKDIESYQSTLLLFPVFLFINSSKDFLTDICCNIQPTTGPLPLRCLLRIFSFSLFLTFPTEAPCWSTKIIIMFKSAEQEKKTNKNIKCTSTHKLSIGSHNRMVLQKIEDKLLRFSQFQSVHVRREKQSFCLKKLNCTTYSEQCQ